MEIQCIPFTDGKFYWVFTRHTKRLHVPPCILLIFSGTQIQHFRESLLIFQLLLVSTEIFWYRTKNMSESLLKYYR